MSTFRQQRFINRVNLSGFMQHAAGDIVSRTSSVTKVLNQSSIKDPPYKEIVVGKSVVGGFNKVMRKRGKT